AAAVLLVRLRIGNVVEGDMHAAAVAGLVRAREVDRLLAEARVQLVERRVERARLVLGGEERAGVLLFAHEIRIGHADPEDRAAVLRTARPELVERVEEG